MARFGKQGNPSGPLILLLSVLSAALCVAILVIVNQYLWYGSYCYYVGTSYVCFANNRCYMQTADSQSEVNMCYYSWAAAGVGLFFAFCTCFMQVCSGRYRHVPTCEVLVSVVAVLWWIGAATSGTVYGQNADDVPVVAGSSSSAVDSQALADKKGYRTSIWAMGWANVGLWVLCALLSLKDCAKMRKEPAPAAAYPTGTYAQANPVFQQQAYYGAPPPGYGAPPPPAYGAPGYPPPAAPYAGGDPPAGYPPAPGYPPAQTA